MTVEELQQKIVEFRDARDWKQFHNAKDLSLSLVLEAAEVMEHFQWKNGDEADRHTAAHREEIAEELADMLWYMLLLADGLEIDLEQALLKKLEKNNQRYAREKSRGNHKKYTEFDQS